jgi:hypothetical protein
MSISLDNLYYKKQQGFPVTQNIIQTSKCQHQSLTIVEVTITFGND